MKKVSDIIIVGGGQAAGQVLVSLKQKKFSGKITLIGKENVYPYQRPPLSKAYLKGEIERDRLFIKQPNFYDDIDIDFALNKEVVKVDTERKSVQTHDNEFHFKKLVLATGSRPRKIDIDGSDLGNIFYLRNIRDAENIKCAMQKSESLVIIGAGYIGLEVAATAIKYGLTVTVIEKEERVMNRVVSKDVSRFFQSEHEDKGVRFLFNQNINYFSGENGNVAKIHLSSNETIQSDLVLVGVGGVPNIEIADNTKIEIDNGIKVDSACRTNVEDIFAIGDCTNHWNNIYQRYIRLESVQNAIDQAKVVAENISSGDVSYDSVPWFWSDQYDIKLQIAGVSQNFDEVIIRGNALEKSFSCLYLKNRTLIAVDAINRPRDFIHSKNLIYHKTIIDDDKNNIKEIDLKEYLHKS